MERLKVSSSSIKSMGYDKGVLEIEFMGGSVYDYTGPGVETLASAMLKAPSIGQFFEKYIRLNASLKAVKVK